MEFLRSFPIEVVYGVIAMVGGCARYLNSYTMGGIKFSLGIFIASAFVSGFSGYMFALLGESLHMPHPVTYIMAGLGGFFGDQTMKFIMEYFTKKIV